MPRARAATAATPVSDPTQGLRTFLSIVRSRQDAQLDAKEEIVKSPGRDLRTGEEPARETRVMADFLVALAIIGFTAAFLAYIWALDRV